MDNKTLMSLEYEKEQNKLYLRNKPYKYILKNYDATEHKGKDIIRINPETKKLEIMYKLSIDTQHGEDATFKRRSLNTELLIQFALIKNISKYVILELCDIEEEDFFMNTLESLLE